LSAAADLVAAAVPENVPHDPARAAKPSGTPGCKNACTSVHAATRKVHNNPADRTAALKILGFQASCAGPRAGIPRQLTLLPAHDNAADNAGSVPCGVHDLARSPDTAARPASAASVWLPAGKVHCNSACVDATA